MPAEAVGTVVPNVMKTASLLSIVGCCCLSPVLYAAEIVDVSKLDRPPERLEYAAVTPPPELADKGISDTVRMEAVIGIDGRVVEINNVAAEHPEAGAAASAAVRKWRFAPAFVGGEPVSFRLPVAIAIRPGQSSGEGADTGAKVGAFGGTVVEVAEPTYQTIPAYPEALRETPVEGYAMVNLLVDAEGKPSDVVVEFATRPEFAAAAAAAVLEWAFTPAQYEGKPAPSRATVDVRFIIESAAWSEDIRDLKSRLQYVRSYDESPTEKSRAPVVFPFQALIENRQGGVTMNLIIDPVGRVAQAVPGPGSDLDYVGAVQASLANWEFVPATKADRPVFAMIAMQFTFDPYREEFQFDSTAYDLIKGLRDGTATVYSLKQVTQMPKPVRQVQPVLPVGYEGEANGEAMIEFIIDKNGRAQLPKVVRATNAGLGWAAATAVAQWHFEPAKKDGEIVAVRARQPIRFSPPKNPAAP